VGPTSFRELQTAWQEAERPRETRDYIAVNKLKDGRDKATLNIHTGTDGGYAECKYYTDVCVTYLTDDLSEVNVHGAALVRACGILNPFLDKYRLLNEDYRVSAVSLERNFYFATCHTSPLGGDEVGLSVSELFERLQKPRNFLAKLGYGAANILRTNSFELLGPRDPVPDTFLQVLRAFIKEDYVLPLSYELILDALSCLQRTRDYRLAIVHAETAVEVHIRSLLLKLMVQHGITESDADSRIDHDDTYWGVKKKIRRLDDWMSKYCAASHKAFVPFLDSALYGNWKTELYDRRNAAVHAGASAFRYDHASRGIGVAKECIVEMEAKVPGLQNRVQLNSSMANFRLNPGEVMF
jgi:hypothetical protein